MKPTLELIRESLHDTDDLIARPLELEGQSAILVYIETLCDTSKLEISLLKQWFRLRSEPSDAETVERMLTAAEVESCNSVTDAVSALLQGRGMVGIPGTGEWFSFNSEQNYVRSLQEPVNEQSIIGERIGFVESLTANLNLIRNRSSANELKIRYLHIGKHSRKVAVVWLQGVADDTVTQETIKRLLNLSTNMEVHPGRLMSQLKERKRTFFPQIYGTERIDMATSLIMQGRIAVLCEQSSTCLIVPASLYTFLHSTDAILLGGGVAFFLRSLRAIGMLVSLYINSLYVAITSFHHEVLPARMSINIKSSLENVPYSPIIETLLMIVIFQMIAEATIRLPSQIAQMVGVAGGIIVSESLVKIGFVSNVYIVIVSLSMIGSFLIPTYQMRILTLFIQLMLIFGATLLGFYGIVFVTVALLAHFFSLEPFGVPYCIPIRSRAK